MEVQDTESNSRGLTSVVRGERILNRIILVGAKGERPAKLRIGSSRWVRELFASHQSPGESSAVNWYEFALTALAWVLMASVVIALLYFCYQVYLFVRAY